MIAQVSAGPKLVRSLGMVLLLLSGLVAPVPSQAQKEQAEPGFCDVVESYARMTMIRRQEGTSARELLLDFAARFERRSRRRPSFQGAYLAMLDQVESIVEDAYAQEVRPSREARSISVDEFAGYWQGLCIFAAE